MNCEKIAVFYAAAPQQLIDSIYYASKVNWKGMKKVLIWDHFYLSHPIEISQIKVYFDKIIEVKKEPQHILKRQIYRIRYNGWLFRTTELYKWLRDSNIQLVISFVDSLPLFLKSMKVISKKSASVILVEEGIGTYVVSKKKKKIRDFLRGIETLSYIGESSYVNYFFVTHPELLPAQKCIGRKIVLKNKVYLDKIWIKGLSFLNEVLPVSKNQKRILWLSGPLVNNGVSEERELEVISCIVDRFDEYVFIIKPHHAESKHKYDSLRNKNNIQILEMGDLFWLPIEILAEGIQPDIVMTVLSSALGNMMDMGISAKYVYLYKFFKELDIYDNLELFFKVYQQKENVFFPDNFDSLLQDMAIACAYKMDITENQNKDILQIEALIDGEGHTHG